MAGEGKLLLYFHMNIIKKYYNETALIFNYINAVFCHSAYLKKLIIAMTTYTQDSNLIGKTSLNEILFQVVRCPLNSCPISMNKEKKLAQSKWLTKNYCNIRVVR